MKNVSVLISGTGTNLQRIIECINAGEIPHAKINLVIADRKCVGLQKADAAKLPTKLLKRGQDFQTNLLESIPDDTDLIILAGFLSILSSEFCSKYDGKIINIHPSLLPKFGGIGMWGNNVHQAVLANAESESGATVHLVTAGVDEGKIILQKSFLIDSDETVESLGKKVHEIEYEIFPKAINKIINPKN